MKKLDKVVFQLKRYVNAVKSNIDPIMNNRINFMDGICYYKNNSVLFANGLYIACVQSDKHGHVAIFVDDEFESMSINARRAILYHEVSHIALGHLNKDSFCDQYANSISSLLHGIDYREVEADKKAASMLGLEEYIDALLETSAKYYVDSAVIDKRIALLRSL